jgi:hypothetical protein
MTQLAVDFDRAAEELVIPMLDAAPLIAKYLFV